MALENLEFKDQIGLICEGSKIVKREKKRGGRGRKEEEEGGPSQKGMELGFLVWKLNLCINFHALMVILLPKSRVFARVSS